MEDILRNHIAPKDFPTATELALISSELSKGPGNFPPHQQVDKALALWESCFILIELRKKDSVLLTEFVQKHQSILDSIPPWPDNDRAIITFAKFSRLVRNGVSAKLFKESYESFIFFNHFCTKWWEKSVYAESAVIIKFNEQRGTSRAKELVTFMDQHEIAAELEPICSVYLMIEAQKKKSGVITELPLKIDPVIFSLENFTRAESLAKDVIETGVRNDQYEGMGIILHLWSRYYQLTRSHFNKSKSTLYRQS